MGRLNKKQENLRTFKTPQELEEAFYEYEQWSKDNPIISTEFHGKNGEERLKPNVRMLSIGGFYAYFRKVKGKFIMQYFENHEGRYSEFQPIVQFIKEYTRNHQLENGAAKTLDSNLIGKLNGVADSLKVEMQVEPRVFKI